ncbi:hypothetical protein EV175_000230 [Coemansia sp. RSA 1933]|nr:hypothetical protein EV175_000230 [Coemansia sp. RSA 1933]
MDVVHFAQTVRGHPKFDGKMATLTVEGFSVLLDSVFRALGVTDPVRQGTLAEAMLESKVLQSWVAYCRAENILGMARLGQLLHFLTVTYDSVSSSYQALEELQQLTFAVEDELAAFNHTFDHLVARAELPALPATLILNHYRRAMPIDIKKELFATDIATVGQAKARALVLWRIRKTLHMTPAETATANGPEPMDVDQLRIKRSRRPGLRFKASVFPCSEQEFEERLRNHQCVYCGGANHIYSRCRFRVTDKEKLKTRVRSIAKDEPVSETSDESGNAQ